MRIIWSWRNVNNLQEIFSSKGCGILTFCVEDEFLNVKMSFGHLWSKRLNCNDVIGSLDEKYQAAQ
jgi:hypothetical protein